MAKLPSVFVSHGSPMLILEDVPARDFLRTLPQRVGTPKAIVAISGHDIAGAPSVGASATHEAVHDFYGFPQALYELRYEPPGDPALARGVFARLTDAGIAATLREEPGIDHGVWAPLKLAFPSADIPVVPLALTGSMDAALHIAMGRALAPLRNDGVLVMGSGSFTHNLREMSRGSVASETPPYVREFTEWIARTLERGDDDAIAHWRSRAPHAVRAHPTPEHFEPLLVAYGAGGTRPRVEHLHSSTTYGNLAMDAFAFH
jgi:4,5-DOPA dioxygenase extradiol